MQDLQGPLSLAEREQAALEAAKSRWSRSMQVEKVDFDRRRADKVAAAKGKDKAQPTPSVPRTIVVTHRLEVIPSLPRP